MTRDVKFELDRADELRRMLDLREERRRTDDKQNAGVLILLHDDGTDDIKVLLCVRSRNLRRHPGEVCFPGGMMDDEDRDDVRQTAIREAYEEVGIKENDDYVVLGNFPAFQARFGIVIHPTVALARRLPKFTISIDEVESVFWVSLSRFLENKHHSHYPIGHSYTVHMFQFGDYPTTYGITALFCIFVAIGVLTKIPQFNLLPNFTINDIMDRRLNSIEIIRNVYELAGDVPVPLKSKM
uniref:Nudix hydrolase domain-containing protein n=1 Tax=Caenorhabditis japonica TaxID=281687 RepID=A0A8R1I109_CAEJA